MKSIIQQEQEKLDKRIKEIREMDDESLVANFRHSAILEYQSRKDMRTELADNTYNDMRLLWGEILDRLTFLKQSNQRFESRKVSQKPNK